MYPSISFLDKSFKTKVISELKENGLVVINDVISDRDCDKLVDGIVNKFRLLCPELKTSGSDLWQDEHLVPQTRPGLIQSALALIPFEYYICFVGKVPVPLHGEMRHAVCTSCVVQLDKCPICRVEL